MRRLVIILGVLFLGIRASWAAEQAPDFTLRDIDGQQHSLSQYAGNVVLISFWATWCTPCMAEMPQLQRLWDTYSPQGLTILSISTDDARSGSQVKPIVKSKGLTCPVLLDRETSVVAMYNPAKTLPFSVVLDREGKIVQVHSGYTPGDEVALEEEIKALLAGGAPEPVAPAVDPVPAADPTAGEAAPATDPAVPTP